MRVCLNTAAREHVIWHEVESVQTGHMMCRGLDAPGRTRRRWRPEDMASGWMPSFSQPVRTRPLVARYTECSCGCGQGWCGTSVCRLIRAEDVSMMESIGVAGLWLQGGSKRALAMRSVPCVSGTVVSVGWPKTRSSYGGSGVGTPPGHGLWTVDPRTCPGGAKQRRRRASW